jgi:transcriptional regulator with XRE-family HTH domain
LSEVVTSGSLDDEGASVPLGVTLARLRRAHDMTGEELGRRAGMSQAKVSKIETGVVVPSPQDVERLARALNADLDLVRRLTDQAESSHNRMTDWRLRSGGLAAGQRELARVEQTTTVFRQFQPATIGGLLQTTEYARAVLSVLSTGRSAGDDPEDSEAIAEAVSARIQRQEVLADPKKTFVFVMPETVLLHLICHPADMPAQIHRIKEVSRQENVSITLIPSTTRFAYPPFHGFSLFDDRLVLVDLINTFITSRGRADVRLYRRVFESFEQQVVTDIDAILNRYLNLYLDLARP